MITKREFWLSIIIGSDTVFREIHALKIEQL